MKKKIAILGSTGSIGKSTIKIIKKNRSDFEVVLLSTNKNINEIHKQAKDLKVKNIIVNSRIHYEKLKKKKIKNLRIFSSHKNFHKIFNKKIDYTMSAISGLNGLKPTIDIIKYTKFIGIANKESIICAWNLIHYELKKYKTNFIPIDSEHFSIWSLLRNENSKINYIYLTASGGPFLNKPKKYLKKVNPLQALKHPNWKMGKKISIDSATMMNKVFEIIEAKKIFDLKYNQLKILIHPKSYVHAMIKFDNGLIKLLAHDTNMEIPIFNFLHYHKNKTLTSKPVNLKVLNNLDFSYPLKNQFPILKVINILPDNCSLFETILITLNDELVSQFLKKKIKYNEISQYLLKIIKIKEFKKYIYKRPKNIKEIEKIMRFSKVQIVKYIERKGNV